ncbi:MAG TPA: Crp/Fnr family transcriptional regulator [Dehalococcoidia bacterium]|nr:Crp/Fnr family transcriptional regulator [Dehalococcoidia bacterium]
MEGQRVLAQVPLFTGLSSEELDALAALSRRRRYGKGEVVFRQGDPGSVLYIIESGQVKLTLTSTDGKEVILALLGPGGFFGELSLLDGEPRSADAVARLDSLLWALQRQHFLEFLDGRPRAARGLLAALSRRLRRTTELVQDAGFLDVPGRLARALLQMSEAAGQAGPDGVVVSPRLTQAELAEMVGATRESVNKWLGVYERQGLLRRQRGLITVLRPDELRNRVD